MSADRLVDSHVCGVCGGNLVVMLQRPPGSFHAEYGYRCVNNCDQTRSPQKRGGLLQRYAEGKLSLGDSNTVKEKLEAIMADKELRPVSERFTDIVIREFSGLTGQKVELTDLQKKLAQHLFIKVDQSLRSFESKRKAAALPFIWNNINLDKMALDAIYRIDLGLDALIPNHIHPVPYLNERLGKYDIDLRIGYAGQDYIHRRFALDPPVNVIYELVYETDVFRPIKCPDGSSEFEFKITQPFNRGNIVGGFGYVLYDDKRRNVLVLVSEDDFVKSQSKARSNEFWDNYPTEMRYKTLVHRTTNHIPLDPVKTNRSFSFNKIREEESTVIDGEFHEIAPLASLDSAPPVTQPAQAPPPKREPTPPTSATPPTEEDGTARMRASMVEITRKYLGADAYETVLLPEIQKRGKNDLTDMDSAELTALNKWLTDLITEKTEPKRTPRRTAKPKEATKPAQDPQPGEPKTEPKAEETKSAKPAPSDQVRALVVEMQTKKFSNDDIKKLLHESTGKKAGWDNNDAPKIRAAIDAKEQKSQAQTEDDIERFLREQNGQS